MIFNFNTQRKAEKLLCQALFPIHEQIAEFPSTSEALWEMERFDQTFGFPIIKVGDKLFEVNIHEHWNGEDDLYLIELD